MKREIERLKAAIRGRSDSISVDITPHIAECYKPIHADIEAGAHQDYNLPGGRGSCKSSFVSLEVVQQIMNDKSGLTNAIVFRRIAGTMRESVYSQISWAIAELGVSHLWRGLVSPLQWEYVPTGAQIIFRGLDDAAKLKSIKPRRGSFRVVWFEEFAELPGPETQRSVLQSVVRGGERFIVFRTFNPPMSANNWANKFVAVQDEKALTVYTNYTMIPPEWLGESFLIEAERLKGTNEKAYRHEYMGEATGTGGEVFTNLEIRKITEEEEAAQDYIFCGLDFGFSVDPAACVRLAYDRKKETVLFLGEIYTINASNGDLAEAIKARRWDTMDGKTASRTWDGGYWYSNEQDFICDSAEPKSIADLKRAGIRAKGCKKWPGSVLYGIRWLQKRRLVIDPARTPNVYREFVGYNYKMTRDGIFMADVPDKDNHTIDATRYALEEVIERVTA